MWLWYTILVLSRIISRDWSLIHWYWCYWTAFMTELTGLYYPSVPRPLIAQNHAYNKPHAHGHAHDEVEDKKYDYPATALALTNGEESVRVCIDTIKDGQFFSIILSDSAPIDGRLGLQDLLCLVKKSPLLVPRLIPLFVVGST